ncbi:hypothetical protein CC1G_13706 [Coprinopsis cinerea okayama7|uniref:RFX-type winged-helix domain-containing protein n=1 Tax=Coprinopsis cinerea (strain Okayama-7 / 130 / ATCC MYA-4618 / FGSC 9003) TaxID=240176 RepID=D6RK43_COPC7|nr:hypothetical protein CC1G_13706 [Coprinopsis cinerea okayama7\|eukprot:XP_002912173.1 hypothetical protein CC1G_13706 [Coprinopsis cinerea okayama7\
MAASYYYRPTQAAAPAPRPVANVRDDYERWYTETSSTNRMSLSLRSGIHSEVSWALERLCRLAYNEQFSLNSYPGLIDGLFDWPEWYVTEGYKYATDDNLLFSPPPEHASRYRYAMESMFIMRNAVLNDHNARELAQHSHSLPLILKALENLDFTKDPNQEFLLHILDVFQVLAPNLVIIPSVPDSLNPIIPLNRIVSKSQNRSLVISAFLGLNAVLSHPSNVFHLSKASGALSTAILYLPLFVDKPLLEAALEHIYIHISNPSAARAFLLDPQLPNTLKVLCSLLLAEQAHLEEKVNIDITRPSHTVASNALAARDYELTKEELEEVLPKPEPQRCYDWMRLMLTPRPEGEMTQVEIWTMYKDTFSPHQDKYPMLGASEVIKNITHVYPTAQAMVLPGQVQRFVVRGIDRRKYLNPNQKHQCLWDRSSCSAGVLPSPSELAEHLLEHLTSIGPSGSNTFPCAWSTCNQTLNSIQQLRAHVLTHIPPSQPFQRHPSQSETITLSADDPYYANSTPTMRSVPPPPNTVISFQVPTVDPPSHCLTALLIVRILFRTAFADVEAAPKADEDHFGFPGVVDDEAGAAEAETLASDVEGSRKGRKAFMNVRHLISNIRVKDEALMGWVIEMLAAVTPGH